MRPVRLVLEGFSTFRERVEVDFGEVDLFALVGPTGAGKSSVIDGITFALYGSVARYDDERLVAPVVNQRSTAARVDLAFTVGEDRFRVFREVVRKGARGTTKEARLERVDAEGRPVGAVLAGDAKGVTAAVTDLLGLDFGQFTTCVVLPQGEFARFLHESPAERQALLKRLLDLGLYDRVGARARARATELRAQLDLLEGQLRAAQDHEGPEPEELADRQAALERLLADVEEALPALEEWAREGARAAGASEEAAERARRLRAVQVPEGIDSVAEGIAAADLELAGATTAAAEAQERVDRAQAAVESLPARADLEAVAERRREWTSCQERRAKGEAAVATAAEEVAQATDRLGAAVAAVAAAREALTAGQAEHAAHALAEQLAVGDPCPVCHRPLAERPVHAPGDLAARRAAVDEAVAAEAAAREAERAAEATLVDYRSRVAALADRAEELAARLAEDPSEEEVAGALAARDEAEAALDTARAALKAARGQQRAAERRRRKLDAIATSALQELDDARTRVAAATGGAPPLDRDDLAGSWRALVARAEEGWLAAEAEAAAAREDAERWAARHAEGVAALAQAGAATGVALPAAPAGAQAVRDAVFEALTAVRAAREVAERRRRELAARLDQRDELKEAHAVADSLGRHLRADGFVAWLLEEAVAELVVGASRRLGQLSHGRYSLVPERGGFSVIDHGNADERRPARSLSGGETFLASLALALALADEVARLSAVGAPRLESIFLDEGFGTLDAETLDVVVSAIEELGADGRLVGLVSHVPEVAERVPVRFEVRRDGASASSTVEKVLA